MNRPEIRPAAPYRASIVACICLSLFVALATPAFAQGEEEEERGDWYVEYMLGFSHVPKQTYRSTDAVPVIGGSTESDAVGYFVGGAVGRRFLDAFRGEVQVGFRSTELNDVATRGAASAPGKGDLSLFTAMLNGYFDLDLGDDVPFTPWLGVGVGWGMPRLDGENDPSLNQLAIDDTDSVFVYNAMVGSSYRITEVTEANFGYRYVATEDFELGGTFAGTLTRFDYEYDAHEFYAGIRFNF